MTWYRYESTSWRFGGGRTADGVKLLIFANVAVFFFQEMLGLRESLFQALGLVPHRVWSQFAIWQPVTYMFLHGGFWHLLMNMFILWMFGSDIEREWGRKEFLRFYFITGVGSGIVTTLFSLQSMIPVIGASGAIYGLLLAYWLMYPNRTVYLNFLIPVRVKYFVPFLGAVAFLSSLSGAPSTVSHLTHLSGMAIGYLYLRSDFRIPQLGDLQAKVKVSRAHRKARRLQQKHKEYEQLRDEVDVILDKINEVGYKNLTEDERKVLYEASVIIGRDRKNRN